MRRTLGLLAMALAGVLLAAAAAGGADGGSGLPPVTAPATSPTATTPTAPRPKPPPRIARGIAVGGVDLSHLTVPAAVRKLERKLRPRLQRRIRIIRIHPWRVLAPARVRLKLRSLASARRALHTGARVDRPRHVDLAPIVSWDRRRLRAYVLRVGRATRRPARNARVRLGITGQRIRHARTGRRIDVRALGRVLRDLLANPRLRTAKARVIKVRPRISDHRLRSIYATVVTVQQHSFTLRLFKRLRYDRSYSVAVGQPAYPTPNGYFTVIDKQVNPAWTAPNSPWAGELAGTTTPGGSPSNPLKARWMGIGGGVGIHGTGEDYSIGSRASHGCIRMHVWDVEDLYARVPLGTPVLIAP